MEVGLLIGELCVNVWFSLFHLFISVICASHTSKLSSELELYLSSVKIEADICDEYELL